MPAVRLAQSNSRLHQRGEHRLQVKSRTANDLQHIGGSSLLLSRLDQFVSLTVKSGLQVSKGGGAARGGAL